jgi:hypothetical protein
MKDWRRRISITGTALRLGGGAIVASSSSEAWSF